MPRHVSHICTVTLPSRVEYSGPSVVPPTTALQSPEEVQRETGVPDRIHRLRSGFRRGAPTIPSTRSYEVPNHRVPVSLRPRDPSNIGLEDPRHTEPVRLPGD